MSIEHNKSLAHRYVNDVLIARNHAAAAALYTDDYIDHNPLTGPGAGQAGRAERTSVVQTAFPDLQISLEDVIADEDHVVWRLHLRGTHRGPFLGVEPTGKVVEYDLISIAKVRDGKICERWTQFDKHAILQQFGVL